MCLNPIVYWKQRIIFGGLFLTIFFMKWLFFVKITYVCQSKKIMLFIHSFNLSYYIETKNCKGGQMGHKKNLESSKPIIFTIRKKEYWTSTRRETIKSFYNWIKNCRKGEKLSLVKKFSSAIHWLACGCRHWKDRKFFFFWQKCPIRYFGSPLDISLHDFFVCCLFVCSFVRLFDCLFVCLFVWSFVRLFVCLFVRVWILCLL
jgi:hypothetical protein